MTVGVWVGNFDREELRNSTGVTGAGPIFHQTMLAAVKRVHGGDPAGSDAPIVAPPADVERVPICALSGLRPSTSCPNVTTEWVRTDAPVAFCSWHRRDSIDWPAEYRTWASSLEHPHPARPSAAPASRIAAVHVTSPPNGATYLIDPTLRMAYQSLRLRAAADTPVTWQVNGELVASTEWPLRVGKHTITAIDREGRRDSVEITVK